MTMSLVNFSLSAFGVTMVAMGARMGTLIGLSVGLTAADMAMGLAVMASLMVMSSLIWSCLINTASGCFIASTLTYLGEMMSTMASSCQAQFSERNGPVFSLNSSQQQELTELQANCVKNPEPKEEKEEEEDSDCPQDITGRVAQAVHYKSLLDANDPLQMENRNYAVLRFKSSMLGCVDLVSANGLTILNTEQTSFRVASGHRLGKPIESRWHAEKTAMTRAKEVLGFEHFVSMGVSQIICSRCQPLIVAEKGEIINAGQGVKWKKPKK